MITLVEALAQGRYYPEFVRLEEEVADHVPPLTLARAYARYLQDAGLGEIVRYSVSGMGGEDVLESQDDLEARTAALGPSKARYFAMVTKDKTRLSFSRGVGGRSSWKVEGRYPSETVPKAEWMGAMAKLCIAAAGSPGFEFAVLARHETSWSEFPPQPPLARYNHVVTVTDAEVAAAYDDPDSFW